MGWFPLQKVTKPHNVTREVTVDLQNVSCFKCGLDGHLSRDCPNRTPPRPAPPAAWPSATAVQSEAERHPSAAPVPLRRPASQIADPAPWAYQIRSEMGWKTGTEEDEVRSRGLARDQVTESRMSRFVT